MCKGKYVYAINYTHTLQRHILKHPAAQFGIPEKIFFFFNFNVLSRECTFTQSKVSSPLRVISGHTENYVHSSVKTLHLICVLFLECKCFNCPKCSFVFQEEIGLNFSWPELV